MAENMKTLVALAVIQANIPLSLSTLNGLITVILQKYAKRKRLVKTLYLLSSKNFHITRRKQRQIPRFWMRPGRTNSWWSNFLHDVVISEEWVENFCMSKESFHVLLFHMYILQNCL